jgi:prepilin-type N-terminal cleavage/methylation domain-containing protein
MAVVTPKRSLAMRGMTLIEVLLATVIGAILLLGLNSVVKLGLDAQTEVRGSNEVAYQTRFALERMVDKARLATPKELTAPTAGTTGNWLLPSGCAGAACVMYCRNGSNQLIETVATDTACTGTTVIARNVSVFTAQVPAGMGAVDRAVAVFTLGLTDTAGNTSTMSASARIGGGVQ